jgi:uncharacterized protein
MGTPDKTKETQKQTMIPSFCDTIKASQRHSKPMEPLETIKAQIAQLKPKLQNDYHIIELGIFGSYVRGEQTEDSDVDILVEFDPSFRLDLITYGQIEDRISDELGKKVDLVLKRALKPYIGKVILQEVIYLWSNETSETISLTS